MTNWTLMIVLDLMLAGVVFWVYLHWPRRLINLTRSKKPDWLAVIPGHPNVIPRLFIMKYGPWPQPKQINFSAFTPVRLEADKPVILRGRPNQVRYWGFVFYPDKAQVHGGSLPAIYSPQIAFSEDGTYEVIFSGKPAGVNWVNTGKSTAGMLSMRNYYPQHQTRIQMPAIYYGDKMVLPPREYDYEA